MLRQETALDPFNSIKGTIKTYAGNHYSCHEQYFQFHKRYD